MSEAHLYGQQELEEWVADQPARMASNRLKHKDGYYHSGALLFLT